MIVTGPGVLVDTAVLVDHLRGTQRLATDAVVHYSVISRCELMMADGSDPQVIRRLLGPLVEVPVDGAVAEQAAVLCRSGLAILDALIAATAIVHGLRLVMQTT